MVDGMVGGDTHARLPSSIIELIVRIPSRLSVGLPLVKQWERVSLAT
jgi:hypothetical protein